MHTRSEDHNKGCRAALVLHGCFIKGIVSWLREPLSKEVRSETVFPDSTCQQYMQHEMISPAVLSHKLKGSVDSKKAVKDKSMTMLVPVGFCLLSFF